MHRLGQAINLQYNGGMKTLLVSFALLVLPVLQAAAGAATADLIEQPAALQSPTRFIAKAQDCFCTDRQGTRVELGASICMQVDGRMFTARCEMSLNSPMWREQSDGCATSTLQISYPAGHAG
jgi:hypothetical protein